MVNFLSVAKLGSKGSHTAGEVYYAPNDVVVETGAVLQEFFASLKDQETEAFVLFPSPIFIQELIRHTINVNWNITLIFKDERWLEMIKMAYGNRMKRMQVITWEEFAKEAAFMQSENRSVRILIFSCAVRWRESIPERARIYEVINLIPNKDIEIIELTGEKALSEDILRGEFMYESIKLFPQGIINSARPARKALVHVVKPALLEEKDESNYMIKVQQYLIEVIRDKQYLRLTEDQFIHVGQKELLHKGTKTLRSLYSQEIFRKNITGRTRREAVPYYFTEDISIWDKALIMV